MLLKVFSLVCTVETSGQMSICNHKEPDTTIAVHILHVLEHGLKIFKVRMVDTNDATVLVGAYFSLAMPQAQVDIWVAFVWENVPPFVA